MREKIARFMQGRYGVDQLSRFLLGFGMAAVFVSAFSRVRWISWLGWVAIIVVYVRMLSRDYARCSRQNQKFLEYTKGIRQAWAKQRFRYQDLKTHHIYRCPSCSQKIRVPRGKGKIEINCPKCHTRFIKKS